MGPQCRKRQIKNRENAKCNQKLNNLYNYETSNHQESNKEKKEILNNKFQQNQEKIRKQDQTSREKDITPEERFEEIPDEERFEEIPEEEPTNMAEFFREMDREGIPTLYNNSAKIIK